MYQPEKLKARRKELKLTQKDIADQLGVSYQAYSAWERGIKQPSREKVKRLEQILNAPKGYFTEVEIVRLYNTLSDQGKDQALSYVRGLVQKKNVRTLFQCQKNYTNTMFTNKCLLVSVHRCITIKTMILSILMKN